MEIPNFYIEAWNKCVAFCKSNTCTNSQKNVESLSQVTDTNKYEFKTIITIILYLKWIDSDSR